MPPYFLKAGRPEDLPNKKEQRTYRLLEMLPGSLIWALFIFAVGLSAVIPAAVGLFAIIYDSYWFAKITYFTFHLRSTYSKLHANLKIDWLEKLKQLKPSDFTANHPNLKAWPMFCRSGF